VVKEAELESSVEELVAQIAAKPAMPVAATKSHVNAVTAQMVGAMRAWSDADGLVGGLLDAECIAARQAYARNRGR
jgi:enoyl-CoA hydratase/carnithine racemase